MPTKSATAPAPAEAKIDWYINGKLCGPSMNRLNRVAVFYSAGIDGKKWLSTKEFVALLEKLGVTFPIAKDFDVVLPNGKHIGARVNGSAVPVAAPVKAATAPRARTAKKAAARASVATLDALKAEQIAIRAWKANGSKPDTRPATPLTDAKNAEAQTERQARLDRLSAHAVEKAAPAKKVAPQVTPILKSTAGTGKNARERQAIEKARRGDVTARSRQPEKAAAEARIDELKASV